MTFKDILRQRAKKAQSPKALGKLHPYQILGKPLITEKAYKQVEKANIYWFKVHKEANKIDVKHAIEYAYQVTPKSIRIINVPYKGRMNRKLVRRAYKKAVVTLNQ